MCTVNGLRRCAPGPCSCSCSAAVCWPPCPSCRCACSPRAAPGGAWPAWPRPGSTRTSTRPAARIPLRASVCVAGCAAARAWCRGTRTATAGAFDDAWFPYLLALAGAAGGLLVPAYERFPARRWRSCRSGGCGGRVQRRWRRGRCGRGLGGGGERVRRGRFLLQFQFQRRWRRVVRRGRGRGLVSAQPGVSEVVALAPANTRAAMMPASYRANSGRASSTVAVSSPEASRKLSTIMAM